MKVKTANLIGPALDWAVGMAEPACRADVLWRRMATGHWSPSTRYEQGGPILELAKISRTIDHSGLWLAYNGYNYIDTKEHMQCDCSELVAGLRCYVVSKLGDEVDIPEEFT